MIKSATLRFVSEDALLVEYGNELEEGIYQQVLALDNALRRSRFAQQIETLPGFRSLLIKFDVFSLGQEALLEVVSELDTSVISPVSRNWKVPVCMQGAYAEDLPDVAQILNTSEQSIRALILTSILKLYMYGFAPGFAYLGGLDDRLDIPRRSTPRAPMPEGSLMIAGGLASLASVSMPTGWYVVGRTPLTMFSADRQPMVPFSAGDGLHLYEVTPDEFKKLSAAEDLAGLECLS